MMSLKEKAIEELLAAISKVFPGYSWVVVKPKDFVESFLESSGRFRVEFQPAEKKDFAIVVSDEWESHEEWSGYIACLCCETLPPIKTYPPKRDPEELFKNLKKRMGLIFKTVKEFEKLAGIKKEVKARRYYEKPSEARRREARKAERNRRKTDRKDQEKERNFKQKSNWMFSHPKLTDND